MLTPTFTGESVLEVKRKIRSTSKFLRGRIPVEERRHASECLVRNAAEHIPLLSQVPPSGVIGGYYPLGGEIDPRPLMDWLRQIGWRIALPCVDLPNEPLLFRVWDADAELHEGRHQIHEPSPDAEVCLPSVLLTPLLAFDQYGRRLGYGGGYYDRTLAKFAKDDHKVITIGLAFSVQEIEQVPYDKWDHSMDMVLTERGVFAI